MGPSMRQYVTLWARTCLQCQNAKVSRHTRSDIGKFEPPSSRFKHLHINLLGLLSPSEGFRYCLTCADRFSKYPEAFPQVEISEEAMTKVYISLISRFFPCQGTNCVPDQGTLFETSLFEDLSKFLDTDK
ncbi:retrovirus-related Pol polyprotein from transposon 412 [Nephila pilipes]|uniref:Retrovirus-related Pol polyprotein from transposon 412 n=1 Tax=Nephila pilipes TaxID=299642 RepID=A0A8X6N6Y3_NEPPI|nr:retrovirus-related Pol polyprotein from transposon 412 [Nephila pilipes]